MKRDFVKFLIALCAMIVATSSSAQQADPSSSAGPGIKIRIIVDGAELTAALEDNVASRDFAALLPLDLTLKDYDRTEKIADLPSRLSTKGMPDGIDPDIGDITYFAPWGNLALFYRDFSYARGLVRLGRIETGVERLTGGGSLNARIERVKEPKR
jgi:hypothetical protein